MRQRQRHTLAANVLAAALFALLAGATLSTAARSHTVTPALVALHEGGVAILTLVRRPRMTDCAPGRGAVALAAAGTFLPLLLRVDPHGLGLATLGDCLQLAGALLVLAATLMLGRSFGVIAANRGICTRGLYRVVRHPIYAAYALSCVGVLLDQPSGWNASVLLVWAVVQMGRILAEERVLALDPGYQVYRERVRYRLIPGLW